MLLWIQSLAFNTFNWFFILSRLMISNGIIYCLIRHITRSYCHVNLKQQNRIVKIINNYNMVAYQTSKKIITNTNGSAVEAISINDVMEK